MKKALIMALVLLLMLSFITPAFAVSTNDSRDPTVQAVVTKLKGNTNTLTITVKDISGTYVEAFVINNNAKGTSQRDIRFY